MSARSHREGVSVGQEIDSDDFTPEGRAAFACRLEGCVDVLGALLARPGFGAGERTLGAELEVSLVDAEARPLALNAAVLATAADPRLAAELLRFNLEANLDYEALRNGAFATLERELTDALALMRRAAAAHGGRVVTIGTLPTLEPGDLEAGAFSELTRFRLLSTTIRRLRRGPFDLRITGEDTLSTRWENVAPEGANTALHLHLRATPEEFTDLYNAAQLATAPALAISGNSPIFLGHVLWEETRVALFKQATDDRDPVRRAHHDDARVSLGKHWLSGSASELFREAVEAHTPLLPAVSDEDPRAELAAGRAPALAELRLHMGTVWHWNRPVYDNGDGGHLRIELRALPSGPTVRDMTANAAFLVGLTLGLAPSAPALTSGLEFAHAERNFYRAAQHGLAARLHWPGRGEQPAAASDLVHSLLPCAREGLVSAGVETDVADDLLEVVARRLETGQTGSCWQRRQLAALEPALDRPAALAAMLERYLALSEGGNPVHEWPIERAT
jgi:hypothetical protein